jgi:acetylornithine deacetylase
VCGPGDIAQAHQPDEWIAVDQLGACVRFVDALAGHLAG